MEKRLFFCGLVAITIWCWLPVWYISGTQWSESKLPSSCSSSVNESAFCHLCKMPEIRSLKDLCWCAASWVPSMVDWISIHGWLNLHPWVTGSVALGLWKHSTSWRDHVAEQAAISWHLVSKKERRGQILMSPSRTWPIFLSLDHTWYVFSIFLRAYHDGL